VHFGLKKIFSIGYLLGAGLTLLWCLYSGAFDPNPLLVPLLVMAAGPLGHRLIAFDDWQVAHHKVRLPRVSLLVLSGMAVILLFADRNSTILLLALLNLGGFVLDTYWASFDRI